MKACTEILGYPIIAEAVKLDDGWDVSIIGGCRTHVGAVSIAAPGEAVQTVERPEHRDARVSSAWAATLAEKWKSPVCVRCGIHYDGVNREQIGMIVKACESLLSSIIICCAPFHKTVTDTISCMPTPYRLPPARRIHPNGECCRCEDNRLLH